MKHIERLQKFMNLAFKHDWIKRNPFKLYKLKFEKYERPFLEQHEVDAIENASLSEQKLCLTRDLFIFSCYTGLAYAEVKNLKRKNIVEGIDGEPWIKMRRQKTNTPVKLPLLVKAKKLIDKYVDRSKSSANSSLFNVYTNQKVNENLKEIAKICNIDKYLTFHIARHTFATTISLLNGVPIETVSKMLGHTKLSTTQKYARVLEKKISEDMSLLKAKLEKTDKSPKPKGTKFTHLKLV